MAQGWVIDGTGDTITFNEPPGVGTNNIVVTEYAAGARGGSPKWALASWSGETGYPTEVEFYSDRLWWAGTPIEPQRIWGSEIGNYTSHGRQTPMVDSDAVSFAINTRQVNAVTDLIPMDKMVVLAKGGEFLMRGGQDDVITPSTISIKQQSFLGSSGVQAKIVGDTAIFVQEQGQRVCDIGYRFEADGYRPVDISVWASHLVESHELLRIEWAPAPWACLWFARDDGTTIACTYMPDQKVIGWHRHDTGRALDTNAGDDAIEDIVTLPGDAETNIFTLVKRTVNGVTKRYIEQSAPEFVDDIRDWKYCDASLTFDGRNTTATPLVLSGGTQWTETEQLTLTASAGLFTGPSDEGDGFILTAGDDSVRVLILAYVNATTVTVRSYGTVPAALRGVAVADWTLQRDTIGGLGHLEGREVVVLADGSVHPKRTVTGGQISLQNPGGVVTVGLPYRGHIETLEVNSPGEATIRGNKKLLTSVGLLIQDSRGVKVCGGELRAQYTYELPQREFEDYGQPTQPLTGYGEVPVSAEWGENLGHFHIISDDPLPMVVLGMIPRFIESGRVG